MQIFFLVFTIVFTNFSKSCEHIQKYSKIGVAIKNKLSEKFSFHKGKLGFQIYTLLKKQKIEFSSYHFFIITKNNSFYYLYSKLKII